MQIVRNSQEFLRSYGPRCCNAALFRVTFARNRILSEICIAPPSIVSHFEGLDRAALARRSGITIPLARYVLEEVETEQAR